MASVVEPATDRLSEFPISFFAAVMGLGGLALALRASEHAIGATWGAWIAAAAIAIVVFVVVSVFYVVKAMTRRQAVASEWRHPVRIAFFPAISISLLLIATILTPAARSVAEGVWIIGALLQAGLTLSVLANWIGHRAYEPIHLNPAWFIPAVGNVVAPIAGAQLGYIEASWLFFSAGLMFWIILLTLVINRLVFHDPLPGRLAPTLVILIAPPAVAFLSYVALTDAIDPFARILLNGAYVFAGVVATQLSKLRRLGFALSWWALSFPVAALAIASLRFAEATGSATHEAIGFALVALAAAIVLGLTFRTLAAIRAGEICRPES